MMGAPPPVIIVTGASSGVGLATVRRLSERVERVYALSRRGTTHRAPNVIAVACDLRNAHDVDARLAAAAGDASVAAIVHCAAIGRYAPLSEPFSAAWADMVNTNLLGLAHLVSGAHRLMPDYEHLVHVGSLAAQRTSRSPGIEMYAASKAGAQVLLRDYRRSLRVSGSERRVTVVTPGFIGGTEFGSHYFDHAPERDVDLYDAAGFESLTAEDVADVIVDALAWPRRVEPGEIIVRPVGQAE